MMMNCEEEKRNLLANCTHCNSIAQQHSTAHSNALPLPAQLIIALIESSHTSAHPPATMLWADKHRPLSLCKLQLHSSVNQRLLRLCSAPRDLPHLLLYGPPGAGKGVRVHCLLRQLFGPAVDRRKVHHKQFKVNTKTIDLSLIGSAHHLELNPSEVGAFNDRHVVQEVIKELASTATVTSALHNNNDTSASNSQQQQSIHYKVVVLTEVDHLSLQAQQALRRTMEQYTATCRLILVCSSLTKVIAPLRSRCLGIRLSAPSANESRSLLREVCQKEHLQCSDALLDRLVNQSAGNLRRALLCLEAARVRAGATTTMSHSATSATATSSSSSALTQSALTTLSDQAPLPLPDWLEMIDACARMICQEQSPARLLLVRSKLYELLSNCIPQTVILRCLTVSLLRRCDDCIKTRVCELSAEYDARMSLGSKPIFHLEAFVAKFMAKYKQWVLTTFG